MSHDDFILGYQSGQLGGSVSVFLILRLFFAGRIREKRIVIRLVGWAVDLLLLVGLSALAFFCLPTLWAILGAIIIFAVFLLGFFHQLSELVVSTALANKQFYEFTKSERALCVSTDSESNLPKLPKVVPMQRPRRAQR
jgi:hypothetical protein